MLVNITVWSNTVYLYTASNGAMSMGSSCLLVDTIIIQWHCLWVEWDSTSLPLQVNIDHQTTKEIVENMKSPSRETFEKAQHSIYLLMARDSYVRFIRSEAFQSAAKREASWSSLTHHSRFTNKLCSRFSGDFVSCSCVSTLPDHIYLAHCVFYRFIPFLQS